MNFTYPVSLTVAPPNNFAPFCPAPSGKGNLSMSSVSLCVQSVYVSCCDAIRLSWSWFGATLILLIHGVKSAPWGNCSTAVCLLYAVRGNTLDGWVKLAWNYEEQDKTVKNIHIFLRYVDNLIGKFSILVKITQKNDLALTANVKVCKKKS